MTGYLIYDPWEAKKNQKFIQLFQKWGNQSGIHFYYVPIEEYQKRSLPDVVINRTRQPEVSRYYEAREIIVLHSEKIVTLGNHKYKALEYFREALSEKILMSKWTPKTWLYPPERIEAVIRGEEELPSGNVIKSVDGHGGSQVFLSDQKEYWAKELKGKACILQERIESASQDMRVYIVGGQIYKAVLRTGGADFRSNYSLGGSVAEYPLNEQERDLIAEYLRCFEQRELALAGLDFIVSAGGKLIFNELEEMVGTRMLYQCTQCDIVRDYVLWLRRFLENTGCNSSVI